MEDGNNISKLEQIANEARKALVTKNVFNDESEANQYSATHSYALSDEETPIHGKGTGGYLDVNGGGGQYDIKGLAKVPGSGREGNLKFNDYKSGQEYQKPDTSSLGNIVY
jgi:hypothetical protein